MTEDSIMPLGAARAMVSAWRDFAYTDEIEVRYWQRFDNGVVRVPEPMTMKVISAAEKPLHRLEPVMRLDMSAAQKLMDELWNLGIRPTEGHGSTGQLAATQAHLQDMRTIAFAKVAVAPP